ncbi:MAG TPA: FkbM family methyltransferase [Polyangiales bacterium]|nr:FkbM family methyltransferase [Polyangiales bacterium]
MVSLDALKTSLSGLKRRFRREPRHAEPISLPKARLGTEYGGYAVAVELLRPESVVYSVGIGEDASFDLALIARFGCSVHAFDPTPRSLSWVRAQPDLPPQFHVHAYGLADYDGIASFAPPKNPAHVSFNQLPGKQDARVELPVRQLSTLMRELGHERLDVLKLDIEGGEYAVLDALAAGPALPTQLLVEFHHQLRGIPVSRTERALGGLHELGYRIFDRQPGGHEYSLVRV